MRLTKFFSKLIGVLCVVITVNTAWQNKLILPSATVTASVENQNKSFFGTVLPNHLVRNALERNTAHVYQIHLAAGQFLRWKIKKSGGKITGRLISPDNQNLLNFDCRANQTTPIFVLAQASGFYQLELSAPQNSALTGKYEVITDLPRPATHTDQFLIEAQNSLSKAEGYWQEWTVETTEKAVEMFQKTLEKWEKGQEFKEAILVAKQTGDVYLEKGDPHQAIKFYQQARALSRTIGDRQGESLSLSQISAVLLLIGKESEAHVAGQEALKIGRSLGETPEIIAALIQVAEIYASQEKSSRALTLLNEALVISRKLENQFWEAQTYLNFGRTQAQLNQVEAALESYSKALRLWEELGDKRNKTNTLVAIGHAYLRLGETQKALVNYSQAKILLQDSPANIERARLLNGLGVIYERHGFLDKALQYRQEALSLYRAAHFRTAKSILLWRIAETYKALGDVKVAYNFYRQSLKAFRELKDRRFQALVLKSIGKIYEESGMLAKARENYQKALDFNLAIGEKRDTAYVLNNLGHLIEIRKNLPQALKNYHRALKLNRENSDPFGEATTLFNIARVEQKQNNLPQARATMEAALAKIESLREKVGSQDLRSSYFASIHELYENYIDLLMQMHATEPTAGFEIAAWQAAERARARSLFEELSEAQKATAPESKGRLLAEERRLSKSLAEREARRVELAAKQIEQNEIAQLSKEIDRINFDLETLRSRIRADDVPSAQYSINLSELQKQLSEDVLLLEYSLGEKQSYLWAITRSSVKINVLPPRAEIEKSVETLRKLLTVRQSPVGTSLAHRREEIERAEKTYASVAAQLSHVILRPVAEQLQNQKLLIVPDGALHYIPFESLPLPNSETNDALVLNHEVVYQPSAAILLTLGKTFADRPLAPRGVAVIADPVFAPAAESRGNQTSERGLEMDNLSLNLRDAQIFGEDARIPALPASRFEAEAILSATATSENLSVTGFDANKKLATGDELGRYRIVHFATHGILNEKNPAQSGLILSLFDQDGNPQDGFLSLSDIHALQLKSELVVLSACNTGVGKNLRGEGVIGLARGFLVAGAKRTVSSLWRVDDEATAELMKEFYAAMWRDKLTPAAAIRAAKLKMRASTRWNSPYFWAGFVLQGEFQEKINLAAPPQLLNKRTIAVALGGLVAGLSVILIFAVRKWRKFQISVK